MEISTIEMDVEAELVFLVSVCVIFVGLLINDIATNIGKNWNVDRHQEYLIFWRDYMFNLDEVPDGQVVKMMASQGHEMYCHGHGFEPRLGRTWGA